MRENRLIADNLRVSLERIKLTLEDFTDADMLVRPVPGANHAAWQLGHLVNSETRLAAHVAPDAMPELPADFGNTFGQKNTANDDAAQFPPKSELLALFERTREATIRIAESATPELLDQPGFVRLQRIAPTNAHLLLFLHTHAVMHMGQMQVIRRKLGKPVLF